MAALDRVPQICCGSAAAKLLLVVTVNIDYGSYQDLLSWGFDMLNKHHRAAARALKSKTTLGLASVKGFSWQPWGCLNHQSSYLFSLVTIQRMNLPIPHSIHALYNLITITLCADSPNPFRSPLLSPFSLLPPPPSSLSHS